MPASTSSASCATGWGCSSSSALPAFLFFVFGIGDDEAYGSANVAMYVMVSMAAYGAVTATTSVAGSAATEQTMGWGRQVALTPLPSLAFVAIKTAVAMIVAAVPIALIYAIGAATGSSGNAFDWLASAAIVWLGSAVFAVYGLAVCLVFKGENAAGIASGLIVIMASSATSSRRWTGSSWRSAASPRSTGTPGWPATRSRRATSRWRRTRPGVAAAR